MPPCPPPVSYAYGGGNNDDNESFYRQVSRQVRRNKIFVLLFLSLAEFLNQHLFVFLLQLNVADDSEISATFTAQARH